jgi:hypothetical protein
LSLRNVLGTALGTAGLGLMIRNALEAGDALADMADRLGLNVEKLQELQYAARLAGASQEQMETGVRRLNQLLGEAAVGQEESSRALKSLGISALDAQGRVRSTADVLGDLADQMQAARTHTERARMANEAFGRQGASLIPMLAQGRAGLAAAADEARKYGAVADAEMVRKTAAANDAMDRLALVLRGNLVQAIAAVAPTIERLSNALAGLVADFGTIFDRLAPEDLAPLGELANRIADVTAEIERLEKARPSGAAGWIDDPLGVKSRKINAEIERLQAERERLRALLRQRVATDARHPELPPRPDTAAADKRRADQLRAEGLRDLIASIEAEITEYETGLRAIEKFNDEAAADKQRMLDAGRTGTIAAIEADIEEYETGLRAYAALVDAQIAENERLKQEGLQSSLAAIDAEIEAYEEGLRIEAELIDRALTQQRAAVEGFIRPIADSINSAIDRSLTGVIQGTQTIAQAFENMAQSIVLSITQTLIKKGLDQLTNKLIDLALQFGPQLLGAVGLGAAGAGTTVAATPSMVGWGATAMAEGGVVLARPGGTPIIAAEAGQDEAIIPLSRLGGLGAGVEINVINQSGGEVEQRQRTGADGRRIYDFIIKTVQRGAGAGDLDAAMKGNYGVGRRGVLR